VCKEQQALVRRSFSYGFGFDINIQLLFTVVQIYNLFSVFYEVYASNSHKIFRKSYAVLGD